MTHTWLTRAAAAAAAIATLGAMPGAALAVQPAKGQTGGASTTTTLRKVDLKGQISSKLVKADGQALAFIRTSGASGIDRARQLRSTDFTSRASRDVARTAARKAASTADGVFDQLKRIDPSAKLVYTTSYTIPGVAVSADASALRRLAKESDKVVSIEPITLKNPTTATTAQTTAREGATPRNANNDALVQALKTWTQTGKTGKGIDIAIMDTGLDYTHADFGGAGTTEAYQEALSSTADPLTDPTLSKLLDKSKFLGGYDFAGATYDAQNVQTPTPDANPIDGPGGHHGSHVAGTAAGYGVTADGKTFTGDYGKLAEADVQSMTVAPGAAPQAGIYSLKVFGDNGGSTGLMGEALDYTAKLISEGAPIRILSMSLGGSYGGPDDPDTAKINYLTDNMGVLSVVAAGNDGDYTDIMGSPATATSALTVAASQSGGTLQDAITVTSPKMDDPAIPGQYSQNYKDLQNFDVSGKVVKLADPDNLNGCSPYSAEDAAAVKGNIAWVDWDDANVACGSGTRFNNAQAAGAKGILFASQSEIPSAGIAGNADLPGFQVTKSGAASIQSALDAGTLEVRLSSDQRLSKKVDYSKDLQDVIADFTSRGIHGSSDGTAKPDVAAPGVGVVSASAGTGTRPEVMSGTSMATPLTSGVAALTFQAHNGWSPSQVKAQIMNTADHDVTMTDQKTPYGTLMVGTGRIDAYAAVNNQATVADKDNRDAVTGQFGIVQVPKAGYEGKKTFAVTNNSSDPVTYDVSYQARVSTPGVTFTPSVTTLTVPGHATRTFDVTLSIPDQSALRHTRDATQPARMPSIASRDRNYVTDANGIVRLVPQGDSADHTPLRVAVQAAPKPVSKTTIPSLKFADGDAKDGTATVEGDGFAQGDGAEAYDSAVVPTELALTDPAGDEYQDADSQRTLQSADIVAVGATSTAPAFADKSDGKLVFAIETSRTWSRLGHNFFPEIGLDRDGDMSLDTLISVSTAEGDTDTDAVWAEATDLATGKILDQEPIPDATVADSNVAILPVSLKALGMTGDQKTAPVAFMAQTEHADAIHMDQGQQTAVADSTDAAMFDAYNPAVWFGGKTGSGADSASTGDGYSFSDTDGAKFGVHLAASASDPGLKGLTTLMVHLRGEMPVSGDAAQPDVSTATVTYVDKSELRKLVDEASQIKADGYTADSWKAFSDALAHAQEVLASEDATKEDVADAVTKLTDAMKGLKADTTALAALVAQAATLSKDDYTADSWTPFAEALAAAQAVLKSASPSVDQVSGAYSALDAAMKALVKKGEQPAPVDKSELIALVAQASRLAQADYTAASWTPFAQALAQARAVLANDAATAQDVSAATAALRSAMKALVKQSSTSAKPGQSGQGTPAEGAQTARTGAAVAAIVAVVVVAAAVAVALLIARRRSQLASAAAGSDAGSDAGTDDTADAR